MRRPSGNTYVQYSRYDLYYWALPVLTPACVPTGALWVSVKSLTNTDDCTFLWMSGTGGNAAALQRGARTVTFAGCRGSVKR